MTRSPLLLLALGLSLSLPLGTRAASPPVFRAGAAIADISPTGFPVIVNAMFTERSATQTVDRLHARCLALDDGTNRVILAVVDTCMMPRDLIDRAKDLVRAATGVATDRMLVSATHTHSAPAAMGCLGSRVDPRYAAFLPGRIAEGMIAAFQRRVPARVGWAVTQDWAHTFCRRWIRRPDRLLTDPFGQPSVRAHMHPGYESPDAIGPSGPADPGLSLLSLEDVEGRPLAVLANYSQHYYGSPLLSSDYYGRFAGHFARLIGAADNPAFVALMSQGTSGDLMWMDYGRPARDIGYDAYAEEMAQAAAAAWRGIRHRDWVPLDMREARLDLAFRTPDAARLAWARGLADTLQDRLPSTQPEIYALEALHLQARPRAELKLQALRVGDLGITAIPNEVYGITGLKLKTRSPFQPTFNIELANGAEGYIPPPEQHALGGYTTWPARTAGLEPGAEPRIVETLLGLLEDLSGQPRRAPTETHGPYARTVLDLRPAAYWRLGDWSGPQALDSSPQARSAVFEGGVAFRLPGPDGNRAASGHPTAPPVTPNAFSADEINAAVHFAGGRLRAEHPALSASYTVAFWLWNGLPHDARPITGHLFARTSSLRPGAGVESLGLGGTGGAAGRLFFRATGQAQPLAGTTVLTPRTWHWVALVRQQQKIAVFLDGRPEIDADVDAAFTGPSGALLFGDAPDGAASFEGRLDEIAVFDRALDPADLNRLFQAALAPATPAGAASAIPETPPRSPAESLATLHARPGFEVELVAAEPLVQSPVALDWDGQGRLWVVEMIDYPLGLDGQGRPGGRIRVLEDVDGDGRYDRSTVFAEGLKFPTGILAWHGGVLVTAAPEILYLEDRDGDGRADVRETLYSGFLEGNQQLRVNGLRWGLDNWVHCASGSHHPGYGRDTRIRLHPSAAEVALGSHDFRIRPDTGELDPQSGPSQYGRNRDDFGAWFGEQNSWPLWHYVLEDQYLRRNPHVPTPSPLHRVLTPSNPKVYPISPQEKRFHSYTDAGHFTSACSAMIYRDVLLFPAGEDLHSFTCEPFHNLVHHAVVTPRGVTFEGHRDPAEADSEFLRSEDRWFRPVMTRTGPDGALWVVDMYRYMIEHPEWLPEEGRQELLPNYRAGEDRGRIYRVFPAGRRPGPIPRLGSLPTADLVARLRDANGWVRDLAQRLLVWRRDETAVPLLQALARDPLPLARLHAWCTLDGLDRLDPALAAAALADPHPRLRVNALRLAEPRGSADVVAAALRLADDPDPRVQLQLACSLGAWDGRQAGQALARLLRDAPPDSFLRAAALSSVPRHLATVVETLGTLGDETRESLVPPLLQTALGLGRREPAARLLRLALDPGQGGKAAVWRRLTAFLDLLAAQETSLDALGQGNDDLSEALREARGWFASAQQRVADPAAADPDRAAALDLLMRHPPTRSLARDEARRWLAAPQTSSALQQAAARALARTGEPDVADALLDAWPSFSPDTRARVLDLLLGREAWTLALLQRVADDRVPRAAFDAARRSRLLRHGSARARDEAARLFADSAEAGRAEVVARFRPSLELDGSAERGWAVFGRLCASCHRLGELGHEVGPDLRAVAGNAGERLLREILDPNALIQPGYEAYRVTLQDGEELDGVIAGDSGPALVLRQADGSSRSVPRRQIRDLRVAGVSLMPEGLEAGLSHQDFADLLAAIRSSATPP